jgi:hypothetical protein
MLERPVVIWIIAFAAVAAGAVGGYLLGANAAPSSQATASVVHADAGDPTTSTEEDPPTPDAAYQAGLERGQRAGTAAGQRAGAQQGSAQGNADAGKAVRDELFTSNGHVREGEATVGPQHLAGDGGILVVGDSLEVLTSPYLKNYLPANKLTINAVGGYSSIQIFGLFQESYDPSQSVIVFDAGTNDNPTLPQILQGELQKVAKIVGPNRCLVVPTIHGLSVNGVNSDGKNRVVAQFVASRPGTQSPDWAQAVRQHPELMQPDNLHPIPEGADYRAQLIAQGVDGCLGGGL